MTAADARPRPRGGYIDPDNFVWVVVGDARRVRPQLERLGLPIEVMTLAGAPPAVPAQRRHGRPGFASRRDPAPLDGEGSASAAGSRGPSCGPAAARPCRRGGGGRPGRRGSRASRPPRRRSGCASRPAARSRSVAPSGRPQIARIWFSNCEVSAPSIVQWPLLWTRGAISLNIGLAADREEFQRQHADMAERVGDAPGERLAPRRSRRRAPAPAGTSERTRMPPSWRLRGASQIDDLAVRAAAEQDREFGVEGDEAFEDRGRAAHRRPRPRRPRPARRSGPGPCRHSRSAGSSGSPARRSAASAASSPARSSTGAKGAGRPPRRCDEASSRSSRSCAISSAATRRVERRPAGERGQRRGRDILELVGDDVDLLGEARQRRLVVERAPGEARGDLGRRRRLVGRVDVAAIAELRRGQRQHPARAGRRRRCRWWSRAGRSFGRFGDAVGLLPAARPRAAPASASSDVARIAAASRPALAAPALPIASVPTGTPAGIWTIESRLSRPASALVSTGTPSTGSRVIEAAMPGRCAAPPAPAMITLSPRPAAPLA